ncbi:MAG: hypothetical protein ACI8RD_007835 [Bacillariaceae sp.]|jgi:hypothetical protein
MTLLLFARAIWTWSTIFVVTLFFGLQHINCSSFVLLRHTTISPKKLLTIKRTPHNVLKRNFGVSDQQVGMMRIKNNKKSDKTSKTALAFSVSDIEATAFRIYNYYDIDSTTFILSSTTENSSSFGFGFGTIGIILSTAAVGAFIFANIVYTPEIVKGAQQLRQSNREIEIRKLLAAVHSHCQEDGNELVELRLPIETALGTTLEEYITAVESESESNLNLNLSSKETTDRAFTTADQDLVIILKKNKL